MFLFFLIFFFFIKVESIENIREAYIYVYSLYCSQKLERRRSY